MGVGQDAVGPADVVIDHFGLVLEELGPGILLVVDDLQEHLVEPLDDVRLRLAEGHLVGDLEDVAQRLRAFAVQAADGQTKLVDRLDNLVNLLAQD